MTAEEFKNIRHDKDEAQQQKRKLTKVELIMKLQQRGITIKGNNKNIVQAAQERGIPIKEEQAIIIEGWDGKAKGLLQVSWEHGFIDPTKNVKTDYTISGKKNALGILQCETSLKVIISNCTDFEEEEMMLQCC